MQSIIWFFFIIYLIGYKLNNPSNETESMLKYNTNCIISDGSLHEADTAENNTCFGKITLKKIFYCIKN